MKFSSTVTLHYDTLFSPFTAPEFDIEKGASIETLLFICLRFMEIIVPSHFCSVGKICCRKGAKVLFEKKLRFHVLRASRRVGGLV